jgi:hypothetical protein
VEIGIPLFQGLSLTIADTSTGDEEYPTRRLQKGLLLLDGGQELAEEGVGFGVPILKRGIQTIFPGGMKLAGERRGSVWTVAAAFDMNLVERLARPGGGNLKSGPLYTAKNSLAALHRRSPQLRRPLTATSVAVRRMFRWVTTFEETPPFATLKVTYTVHGEEGRVNVALDMADLPRDSVTEVAVMSEQGARHFDRYLDSDGISLRGSEIGTWDDVAAKTATFVSTAHGVAFSLGQEEGARLNRGRELIGSRVAWSGFGYSLPPALHGFSYDLRIERVS